MIEREQYLNQLKMFKDEKLIKVITGIRRCGKSTLFEQYIQFLKSIGIKEKQIININLENPKYHFDGYMELYDYVNNKLLSDEKNYVFLDEVQNIDQFQKAVDGLYIKENVDLYITGSNAFILSGELATLLSGRYIEIKMLPLSFKEYFSVFLEEKMDEQKAFSNYIKYGSMPQTVELFKKDPSAVNPYLDGVYSTVVYKDIITRKKIRDKMILESVIKFVSDNIGSPLSSKKISDTLTSMNRKTSYHTVEEYISAFLESFLLYKAERFDVKGKKHLATGYKYYVVDIGIRNYLLGKKSGSDLGHILENIVYLELLRRGYKVYVGKVDNLEIDFVVENSDGIRYYQVAVTTRTKETLERELNSLQKVNDHYPKYILTLDMEPEIDYNGIVKINVIEWLLASVDNW